MLQDMLTKKNYKGYQEEIVEENILHIMDGKNK